MPRYNQICGTCDHVWEVVTVPFCDPACPVCGGETHRLWSGTGIQTIPDDIPGGQWFENGFETPQKFYSHSAHRAALKARGLQIKAKWAGHLDRHLKRWDAPSRKQLEDARILLERQGGVRHESLPTRVPDPDITLTVSDGDTFRVVAKP